MRIFGNGKASFLLDRTDWSKRTTSEGEPLRPENSHTDQSIPSISQPKFLKILAQWKARRECQKSLI